MSRIKEFRNGLTQEIIDKEYSWLNDADIENAVIGRNSAGIVWYAGLWEGGIWKGGLWCHD